MLERVFLKDKDYISLSCTVEREENPYGIILRDDSSPWAKRYSLALFYEGPQTKGKKIRLGYMSNKYLRRYIDLLDEKKKIKVIINLNKIVIGGKTRIIPTGQVISVEEKEE